MKHFKFAQVSDETGISWAIAQPISGPIMPPLPGLTNIIQLDSLYYLGEADDQAQAEPDNYIFELTLEQYAAEIKTLTDRIVQEKLNRLYQEEKDYRRAVFNKYDETATIAGVYKYQEAKELLLDNNAAAPQVRQEASVRGQDVLVVANRIITNHEAFRDKEAKIAGIRGKILDRLTSFVVDVNDPLASWTDFTSVEKIGEEVRPTMNFQTGMMEDKLVDVKVGKYELNIETRVRLLP